MTEGLGDFLRGAVDKVKGFFGGGAQGVAQSDQAAIQDVLVKLDALEKQMAAAGHKPVADFAKHTQSLKQQLSGQPAATDAPQKPSVDPMLAKLGQKVDPMMAKLAHSAEMQRLKNKPSPYGTPGYKPPEGFAPRGMKKESRKWSKKQDRVFLESVFGKKDKKGNWFSY